jgi:hypothetical protein
MTIYFLQVVNILFITYLALLLIVHMFLQEEVEEARIRHMYKVILVWHFPMILVTFIYYIFIALCMMFVRAKKNQVL